MADNVVTFLLENLTQLLTQEAKLLYGVEDQVRLLKNDLSLINIFLQKTAGKRHENLVKELVIQIRDVAYEAEDVIDTFIVTETKHRKRNFLGQTIHSYDRRSALREVANKIERIKNVMNGINNNMSKYGIEIAESSGANTEAAEILHRRRRYVEEDHVVGFAKYSANKDMLKGTLVENLKGVEEKNDEEFRMELFGFLEHIQDRRLKNVNLSPMSKSRRISIHRANCLYISSNHCEPSNIRSLIGFGGVAGHGSPLAKLWENNKLVRVVDLRNMGICCLIPKSIENMTLLRYLRFRSDKLHVIPESICNLWNLETLDMRNFDSAKEGEKSTKQCLPKGIWKLQKLRHLYMDGPTSLPRTRNQAGLPNLQVLTGIAIDQDSESLFARARFPNVRKLGLFSLKAVDSELLSSLHPLHELQTLKIYKHFKLSSPISFQLSLTKITLVDADLSEAIIRVLGCLTNLRRLKAVAARADHVYMDIRLNLDESSFSKLEVLKMVHMHVLQWTMVKGAMPSLQRLVIERCLFVCQPPEELWSLTVLPDVEVLHPCPQLANVLQQLQTRDGYKLQVYPPLDPTM
ncbi:putative late blight resistance protein like protein r1b-8 [Quercus suber]|uniref:Late blight resistance protein like protein r1b-8 n=1 Tax=Quercus suber TaxID=58331 RepID=A0AAW0LRS3_QUESU